MDYSLNAAREMINAYYVEKNIDKLFEHINLRNFTWSGYDLDKSFSNAQDFRKYVVESLPHLRFYNLIDENYTVGGESQDSCFIIAKIKLFDTRTQKIFELHFFSTSSKLVIKCFARIIMLHTLQTQSRKAIRYSSRQMFRSRF